MDHDEVRTELDQISMRLQKDGLPPEASVEERQRHLWKQLLISEATLQSANTELQTLRTQQANEMEEVESYVAHIRGLLEERECLTADYERDNEQIRQELHQLRQQQESQSKEVAEMLAQEGLGEMDLSTSSEQVAYLLVERATLLERLGVAERTLESQILADNLKEVQQQAHIEEISQERNERQRLERDLEEASRRLAMAHQDIRRLTNELDAANSNSLDPTGSDLEVTVQEVENLRKEVDKLKHCDMIKLQQATEHNKRLDAENRALREKVHSLESEKKNVLNQVVLSNTDQKDQKHKSPDNEQQNSPSGHENDDVHKRCREAMEDRLVQVRESHRQQQRLRKAQEELEERNEELEALLGEAQNASKEERHHHEAEIEGLHRKIKNLEAELKKQSSQEKIHSNGGEAKSTEPYLQLHLRDGSQERMALLEARLTEEKDWRKQLEVDLGAAQNALKKDKEALQIGERELKKLRLEVNSLQTECQQGKTLIKSLTQVKGEKAVLEEKLAQTERAHNRIQKELDFYKNGHRTQEDVRGSRLQVEKLQEQANGLTSQLSNLQTAHNALRSEMDSERRQTAELRAQLSTSIQEKLTADGERERLQIEVQSLKELLKWHQEQLSSTKEALISSQKPEVNPAHMEEACRLSCEEGSPDQLSCLKQELNHLQAKLVKEQQLAAQHHLALQAQANEAQAHIKSQDLILSQKAEDAKQMKQDLQRAQSLFSSAERELRYEKEKCTDLKRHNTLLEQEKLKLCAELKQVQAKLAQVGQSVHSQEAECEHQKQKIRELELELARNTTNHSATTSLQEDLQAERVQLIAADKKVLELQQQLKSAQHQLRVEEARTTECERVKRESRDLSDALSALRAKQQEEHLTRKLLEQREEELQQQVRSLRLSEASMTRTNAELSQRRQQLDTHLAVMEAELQKSREEMRETQKSSLKLQEDLAASQQERDRMEEELQEVLLQLDTNVRKYDERQSQYKKKLRQAKQVLLKTTAQKDDIIQKLENDLMLASSLTHMERERIHTVTEENEKLLKEKRELFTKMSETEEMASKSMRTASTVQHRASVLEIENRQLQDRILRLSNQVCASELALRNVKSFYNLENSKTALPSPSLCDRILQTSSLSLTPGSCRNLDILDAICHVKVGERLDNARPSVSTHQPSEQSYLNLTPPSGPEGTKGIENSSNNSDQE